MAHRILIIEDDARNPRYFLTMRGFGYKFIDQNR
jgi:hypothetical protein